MPAGPPTISSPYFLIPAGRATLVGVHQPGAVGMIDWVVRSLALAVVGAAGLVFLTDWAVRRGHLKPFGPWPRLVRRGSDPLLVPLERRLLASGRNPQDASLWLFGGILIAGLHFVSLTRWLIGLVSYLSALSSAGPLAWVRFIVATASALLMAAIVIRVVGKWFGAERWTAWMRPFYTLTDWLILPIRSRMPQFGALDLSPLFAYLAVLIVRTILLALVR